MNRYLGKLSTNFKKRHIEQIELTDNFTTDLDTSLIDEI